MKPRKPRVKLAATVRPPNPFARTAHISKGQNLSDPNRADKLLRRFSWESA